MKTILFLSCVLFSFVASVQGNEYYDVAQKNVAKYNPYRKDYVIVVDYRKSILTNRLFVINMKTGETVIESKVSHAFKSGVLYPTDFSNVPGSYKSSKGNFITGKITPSKFGYAMIIKGLDKGINTNAEDRRIIFHSNTKMKTAWSLGCFATPEDINKKIIDLTHNGCLISVIN